jgi:Mn2+/Fe2+ NRAMP family transporter
MLEKLLNLSPALNSQSFQQNNSCQNQSPNLTPKAHTPFYFISFSRLLHFLLHLSVERLLHFVQKLAGFSFFFFFFFCLVARKPWENQWAFLFSFSLSLEYGN